MELPNQSDQQRNNVKGLLELQDIVRDRDPEPKRQLIENARRGMSPGAMGGQIPHLVPDTEETVDISTEDEVVASMSPEEQTEHVEKVAAFAAFEDLVSRALGKDAERKLSEVSKNLLGISRVDVKEKIDINQELIPTAQGGLIGMALGGKFEGRVPGDGHGMQDNVFMPIQERGEQIATLAVSPKEYVVDAHTMSALGNGNADKGADVMDNVVENIREKAYGTDQQPNQINGLAALRPMMERV
jgi:hypothetical protein